MSTRGDAAGFENLFPDQLVPDVLQLILETWRDFDKPADNEREPRITRRLRKALNSRNRHSEQVPVRIDSEVDAEGVEPGQIDFRFAAGWLPEVYFGVEAKKLNTRSGGRWGSQADAYTGKEGMGRFVRGKYGRGHKHGGMLAYVMDGDCPRAIGCVAEMIADRRVDLRIKPDTNLEQSPLVEDENVLATEHDIHPRQLTIHHLFLAA